MKTPNACPREADILDLIAIEQWPARADVDLRAHAATCPDCASLVTVALAVTGARDIDLSHVRVPDAAIVWHRAQLQARQDAARRAARPMLAAQVAAVLLAVFGGVAWMGGLFSWLGGGLARGWAAASASFNSPPMTPVADASSSAWTSLLSVDVRLAAAALGTLGVVSLALALSKLADQSEE